MENLTVAKAEDVSTRTKKSVAELEEWLVSYLSQMLDIEREEISTKTSFARYGLDSSATISLTTELSDLLGWEIDPTILYSYPTIEALAAHIAS